MNLPLIYFSALIAKLRHKHKSKEKNVQLSDVKPPFVLYLRSFCADKITGEAAYYLTSVYNEEESLVRVLEQIAPVYAIGDPKDEKMPMGATRIYVSDEHWKSTVKSLANKAEAVVLRLGKTDSFWWEVELALKDIPLHKLLFAVPVAETFSEVSTLYKILMDHQIDISDQRIGVNPVKMGSLSSFLYFDTKGKPHSSIVESPKLKIANTYEEILQKSLAGFFEAFITSGPKSDYQ